MKQTNATSPVMQAILVYTDDIETQTCLSPLIYGCGYLMLVTETPDELLEHVLSGRAAFVFDGSGTNAAASALLTCERTIPIVWLLKGRADLDTPAGCLRVTAGLTEAMMRTALQGATAIGADPPPPSASSRAGGTSGVGRTGGAGGRAPASCTSPTDFMDGTTGVALLQQIEKAAHEQDGRVDPTGRQEYLRACTKLGLVPSTRLLEHAAATALSLRYAGLNCLHAASIAAWLTTNQTLLSLDLSLNR